MKIKINDKEVAYTKPADFNAGPAAALAGGRVSEARRQPDLVKMNYPFDIFKPQVAAVIGLLFILVIYVTMVYGPIAAMLVELFPTKIRYTSMSLPYHIGNGWFGGLLPATSFAIVAATGDIYAGLWYPIIFASITASSASSSCRRPRTSTSPSNLSGSAITDRDDKPAAERSAAGFAWSLDRMPDKLQHDLAPVRPRAMLDQIDPLPGAERHFAVSTGICSEPRSAWS